MLVDLRDDLVQIRLAHAVQLQRAAGGDADRAVAEAVGQPVDGR